MLIKHIYKRKARWLLLLAIALLFAGTASADQFNVIFHVDNGKMVDQLNTAIPAADNATVQVIKGSPSNPPKPGKELSAGSIATYGSSNQIVGAVGDGAMGAGGFEFGKSNVDVNNGDGFFVRYWTKNADYYGQAAAQSIGWSNFPTPPYVLPYSSFTLYKADKPYAPTITLIKQVESTNKNLYPDAPEAKVSQLSFTWTDGTTGANGNIQVKGDATHNPYVLSVSKDNTFASAKQYTLSDTSYVLDKTNDPDKTYFGDPNITYYARVRAYNYFGYTDGPTVPFKVAVIGGGTAGTVGSLMALTFIKTNDLGVNQFEFTLDPTQTIYYTGSGQTTTDTAMTASTVKGLADAINAFAGAGTVKSIGWWNNNVNNSQRMEGYTIEGATWTGSNGTSGNGGEKLENGRVYQISVSKTVSNFKLSKDQGQ